MAIVKFFAGLIGIIAAAFVGNYVGDQLRTHATGEKSHQFQVAHDPNGTNSVTVNPNLTNVGPAVVAGMLMKPHLAWAFLGGVLASGLLGEKYEQHAKDYLKSKMPAHKEEGLSEN